MQLSEKLTAKVRQVGPTLVATDDAAADPLPALKKKLAGRRLPVVAVLVREQHHGAPVPAVVLVRVIDPAVETEIKKVLGECGFTVQDIPENELTSFAGGWSPTTSTVGRAGWPRSTCSSRARHSASLPPASATSSVARRARKST